jgi:hypothetical protein
MKSLLYSTEILIEFKWMYFAYSFEKVSALKPRKKINKLDYEKVRISIPTM